MIEISPIGLLPKWRDFSGIAPGFGSNCRFHPLKSSTLDPPIIFPQIHTARPQPEVKGFHLQESSEMSNCVKAAMIFNFACHYTLRRVSGDTYRTCWSGGLRHFGKLPFLSCEFLVSICINHHEKRPLTICCCADRWRRAPWNPFFFPFRPIWSFSAVMWCVPLCSAHNYVEYSWDDGIERRSFNNWSVRFICVAAMENELAFYTCIHLSCSRLLRASKWFWFLLNRVY